VSLLCLKSKSSELAKMSAEYLIEKCKEEKRLCRFKTSLIQNVKIIIKIENTLYDNLW
jgi:hypothetical protein